MDEKLKVNYRWHRQSMLSAAGNPLEFACRAITALDLARRDLVAGKIRYPKEHFSRVSWQDEPRLGFVQDLDGAGLREVGRVEAEGRDIWDKHGCSGWYTSPEGESFKDGTGLAWGMVYQLPGHKGQSRFVAGYVMGGFSNDSPVVDFSRIYVEPRRDSPDYPQGLDAARDAASAANDMAQHAAEEERDYQAAWQAGNRFADLGHEIEVDRAKIIALCRERRAAFQLSTRGGWKQCDAICAAIRESVSLALGRISEARTERRKLQAGDYVSSWLPGFYAGDKRLQTAFDEGAND